MRTGHCITSSAPGPTCQGVRKAAASIMIHARRMGATWLRSSIAAHWQRIITASASMHAPNKLRRSTRRVLTIIQLAVGCLSAITYKLKLQLSACCTTVSSFES